MPVLQSITNARLDTTIGRLDQTIGRLDQTNERVDSMRDELHRAIVESEVRTATAIMSLGTTMTDIKELLSDRLDVRDRVDRCERDIAILKARVG